MHVKQPMGVPPISTNTYLIDRRLLDASDAHCDGPELPGGFVACRAGPFVSA